MQRSGSVEDCLTWDPEVSGLSLTGVPALYYWARHINPLLSTGSTQEDQSQHNWKIVDIRNQNKELEYMQQMY